MSVRLFVGNLDLSIQEKNLQKKFSTYGEITACALKEKKDVDGNVISKFAYVSYDAEVNRISDCIKDLDGTSWKGSNIKVTIAKESFLERLKREREGKDTPSQYEPPPKKKFAKYNEEKTFNKLPYQPNWNENPEIANDEQSFGTPNDNNANVNGFEQNDYYSEKDQYPPDTNQYDDQDQWNSHRPWSGASHTPVPSMVRYDPLVQKTAPEKPSKVPVKKSAKENFKPHVVLSGDLFTGGSEKFSLMEQFRQAATDEANVGEKEERDEPTEESIEIVPPILCKKFFDIKIDNIEEIEAWMAPKEDRSKMFDAIRPTLLNTASTYAANAKTKEENLEKMKRNRSAGKKTRPKHAKNFGRKFKK